jgi:integrase/recombinase XerD
VNQHQYQASPFSHLKPYALAEHLDSFLENLALAGYCPLAISDYAASVSHFGTWLHRKNIPVEGINNDVVSRFAQHRCGCPGGRHHKHLSRRYVNRVWRFTRYLQEREFVPHPPPRTREQIVSILDGFGEWLLDHKGLSPRTVATYERPLRRILPLLGDDPNQYDAALVRRVVREQSEQYGTSEAKHVISSLRAFLRFLAMKGCCDTSLVAAVPTVAQWRLSSLPRYIDSADVERIIDSCDCACPLGLRNRAILLLLARLGLRASDIVMMSIDDLDWRGATVRVCGKSRRDVRLPLPQDAGDAVLEYLEHARPHAASERLFLCVQAPLRPLGNSSVVSAVVRAAVMRAGIDDPPSCGTNLLRHSAATTMLRAGATLDAVSTVLRHRSTDTTAHYAKVDVVALSALAPPWPEGTSC